MQLRKLGTVAAVALLLALAWTFSANHWRSRNTVAEVPAEAVDLGGMLVRLPPGLAEMVEFDPSDSVNRHAPRRVVSMGMHVRHPGIAQSRTLTPGRRTGQPVTIGINTGSQYPGDEALERWVSAVLAQRETKPKYEHYEPVASAIPGLSAYAASGVDPHTHTPYRQHRDAEDVFVHRDANGRVTAAISCSNRPVATAPCRHLMLLSPHARALVYVHYARPLLGEWQAIQADVAALITSFELKPTSIKSRDIPR